MRLQKYFRGLGKKSALATSVGARDGQAANPMAGTHAVLEALADRRFHFRTIPSIATETGMPEGTVRFILERHSDEARRAPLEDGKGNALYAHRLRPRTVREILAETRAFLGGST